ncbi:MAG TPA: Hsp70 family protein, partial [Myxococcota bacterium]
MKLGIDFGTTRTLVATVDRGNYPVVSFIDDDGDAHEHFPSVVAAKDGALLYGFDALTAAKAGAPLVRSFKRALASADVNGADPVRVGDVEARLIDVLTGFLQALAEAVRKKSNVARKKHGELEAVVAVPAHAHGAQRFLTLDAFRRAGFVVKAMVNEPSAAGFEYSHRQGRTLSSKRTRVVVYDLGGGTFDASLVKVDASAVSTSTAGIHHEVLATAGLNRLGGDDFDEILCKLALGAAGVSHLDPLARAQLLDQCREAKERLTPQSRRIPLEVPLRGSVGDTAALVSIGVEEFYDAAAPLVDATLDAMRPLLLRLDADKISDLSEETAEGEPVDVSIDEPGALMSGEELADIAGIYLVGGGSGLPLVPRALKERFGRRVHRSPHPAASTAIGLAIAADEEAGFSLADRLSRSFGVFRERNAGRAVAFDPIFNNETALPAPGASVSVSRRYRAMHNVGHFRFVECSAVDDAGEPRGDLVPFAEVLFPFDPALRNGEQLAEVPV